MKSLLNIYNFKGENIRVGCANGKFLSLLQANGHKGQLTGFDQSEAMLSEATKTNNLIEWN